MARPAARPPTRPAAGLPAYALYGEADQAPAADPLHCESIAERSRLHDWEIRPHRHALLAQVLWVRRGRFEATLDGRVLALAGPALVTVPSMAAHGFRFAPEVDGLVFTVQERHLHALLTRAPGLAQVLLQLRGWSLPRADGRMLAAAATALRDELRQPSRWRAPALDAALLALFVAVARALPPEAPQAAAPPERALAHVRRFRALVEAHYREQPALAALAARLGITPTQLNRVCREVLGRPALAVLHTRLLLEAQRELAYTSMSIKQIALGLGFADAAYFARFFRRAAGQTPTAYRLAGRGSPATRDPVRGAGADA